jgi:hypoxanthine-DNA glycosylase
MPGIRSLQQNKYYGHPLNVFWKIMGELVGAHPGLPYPQRLGILTASGIALWDVLASCRRETSQDAHIRDECANDFAAYFAGHPQITRVFFNGSKAEQCFRRFVLGKQVLPPLSLQRLQSTSPAHAGMSDAEKLQAWRAVISG